MKKWLTIVLFSVACARAAWPKNDPRYAEWRANATSGYELLAPVQQPVQELTLLCTMSLNASNAQIF